MWARTTEVMIGFWLLLSPFIFGHYPESQPLWLSDFICGALVVVIAVAAMWPRIHYVRFANFLVAAWLIGFGYFYGGYPAEPGYQNEIFVGLTLLVFVIVPRDANDPPADWRRSYQRRAEEKSGAR